MSVQVYPALSRTEGKRKGFLEWTTIDLCGDNVSCYKSGHHLISTLPVGIGNTLAIFKTNQQALLSIECPGIFFFAAKLKRRGRSFLKGARRKASLWDYSHEHLVVIRNGNVCPFVKFEIIGPLLCCLLDPLPISTEGHGTLW